MKAMGWLLLASGGIAGGVAVCLGGLFAGDASLVLGGAVLMINGSIGWWLCSVALQSRHPWQALPTIPPPAPRRERNACLHGFGELIEDYEDAHLTKGCPTTTVKLRCVHCGCVYLSNLAQDRGGLL